jgi:hypothetical protein
MFRWLADLFGFGPHRETEPPSQAALNLLRKMADLGGSVLESEPWLGQWKDELREGLKLRLVTGESGWGVHYSLTPAGEQVVSRSRAVV